MFHVKQRKTMDKEKLQKKSYENRRKKIKRTH